MKKMKKKMNKMITVKILYVNGLVILNQKKKILMMVLYVTKTIK